VILIWLGMEDSSLLLPVLLGGVLATILGLLAALEHYGGQAVPSGRFLGGSILFGGVIGASAAIVTILLMVIKTSLHGHPYPDYPLPVLLVVLARLPAWGLAGMLTGLGVGLLAIAAADHPSGN
jgi:hypothetical protein